MRKAVLFDLDGTLWNAVKGVTMSWNRALERMGRPERFTEDRIRTLMGEAAVFPPPFLCYLRPSAAGLLALEKGAETDWAELREAYLRPPHAEKNKKLMEAMGHG